MPSHLIAKYYFLAPCFFILLIISSSFACTLKPEDHLKGGKCVNIGDYTLYMQIHGKESPTMIIDADIGKDSSNWEHLIPHLQEKIRVLTYDRIGLGKSQTMRKFRHQESAQHILDKLYTLLEVEKIEPPYILVGNRVSTLTMQLFARQHPEQVIGVLLIDPVDPYHKYPNHPFQIPHKKYGPSPNAQADYFEAWGIEYSRAQIRHAPSFPNIPLLVLSSAPKNELQSNDVLWQKYQLTIAQQSSMGIHHTIRNDYQNMVTHQPALVIHALQEIIQLSQNRAS